jgi:hypothetical protein
MLSMRKRLSFLPAAATLLAVLAAIVPQASADVIQSTPSMPPDGAYTTPTICLQIGQGICVLNAALYGFNGTETTFDNMGQAIDSNVSFSADIYTNNSDHPGSFLGVLHLVGPIGIFYTGRSSDTELGTFTSTLTELDLIGTFNGHTVELMLAPPPSTGPTTITADGSVFKVSSFFDVFAEISIDHGAPMLGPMRTFTLVPTPEPGTISLMALGLAGMTASELHRRLRSLLSR